jgi:hypothetical protein
MTGPNTLYVVLIVTKAEGNTLPEISARHILMRDLLWLEDA